MARLQSAATCKQRLSVDSSLVEAFVLEIESGTAKVYANSKLLPRMWGCTLWRTFTHYASVLCMKLPKVMYTGSGL